MLSDKTLAIIKPDVSPQQADEIMQLIELKGFTIITKSYRQLTTVTAERLFADQRSKDNYGDLLAFMTSAPVWLLVLSKIEAVTAWQYVLGPEDPMEARMAAPRSLRALFGGGGLRNALHGSATKEAAAAEIKLLFSDLPCANLNQEEAEARAYIAIKLQATLNKALTALARQKPTSDKDAALTFLAEWLLANNPNKPQVVAPEGAASSSSSAAAQRAASEDLSVLLRRQELAQHELQDVMRDGGAARAAAARVAKPGQLANSGAEDVAATKVQAAFRGHKARKQVHAMKSAQPAAGASADAATAGADTSAEQPTEEAAAAAAAEDEAAATEEAAAAAEAEVAAGAVEPAEPVAAAVEAA